MRTSEQINELAAALAKAQGEIEVAHKDSANPYFKSRYADLASVWTACRGPLSRNGLAVVQIPKSDGVAVTMETRLIHASGQWIEGELTAVAKDDGPQSIGSLVTYLRRYMLQSITGVAPDDDDAEAAMGRNAVAPAKASKPQAKPPAETKARTPDEIYASAKKAIQAATAARLPSIRGGIESYASEGSISEDQAATLMALCDKREEELEEVAVSA